MQSFTNLGNQSPDANVSTLPTHIPNPKNVTMPFSSPSPSGEGDSSAGSPDTRLTAPSPSDPIKRTVESFKINGSIGDDDHRGDKKIVQFRPDEQRERENDPFVTPGPASKSGLSPTASAFNPFRISMENFDYPDIQVPANMLSQSMGLSRWLKVIAEHVITPQQISFWLQVCASELDKPHY